MNIFVTGASGFIATHFAQTCLANGHNLVLQSTSSYAKQDSPRVIWLRKSFFSLTHSDIAKADIIVHLASAGVSPKQATWSELFSCNVKGTLKMCGLAKTLDIPIVISGSYSEYGLSAMSYGLIPVDAPLQPTSPYASSKAAAYQAAFGYAKAEKIKLAYLRIFNAYGPGQYYKNLWPSLVNAAISGEDFEMTPGEQVRDFIPVELAVHQILELCDSDLFIAGSPYVVNLASGKPQSVKEFCFQQWSKFSTGGHLKVGALPYRSSEIMRYVPSLKPKHL